MKEKPLVTVVIPIYNAEPYLDNAIRSVINQTYTNWELMLLDDGSTDGSLAIAQRYADKDDRITVYSDGENKGLVPRLNQSIEMANGDYYARMDADDIMYVTRLEKQVAVLESNPMADLVFSSFMTIDKDNNIIGSGYLESGKQPFPHPTIMACMDWFRVYNYDEWAVRAEDFELWCRTSAKSNFMVIKEPLFFYREFGVQTIGNILHSYNTQRKIYAHFSDYGRTFFWCLIHTLSLLAKMLICICYSMTGNLDKFIALRRRKPVPENMCLSAQDLMNSIK